MAENNAYKLKLFQDETARGLARLYEAGYLPNDSMGEVSLRDAESGLVFISIKPGTFYIADPSEYHGSDIAVTTLDGEPVTTVTPPSERLALHLAVYKAPPGRTRHSPHLSRVVLPVLRARRVHSLRAGRAD